jgi:uroporphyrin-III C-methyltransferase
VGKLIVFIAAIKKSVHRQQFFNELDSFFEFPPSLFSRYSCNRGMVVAGKVYLVGAGPGDPELLTLKALRVLRDADVVLHDALVSQDILDLIPGEAVTFNVGKRCGKKAITQNQINDLMISFAALEQGVVRLKCGDPLIFGRAGEEIEALQQSGTEFEIVPGVTAALSAAAAARVSLTNRNLASSVVFATAHRADNSALNWRELALSGSTIVFYMPGQQYAEISERLLDAGLDKDVPCLIVSRASSEAQLIHHATVGSLLYAPALSAPSILLVGKALVPRDLGCQEQQGSSANKSPETAYARALEPPQISRNSQTPHFP